MPKQRKQRKEINKLRKEMKPREILLWRQIQKVQESELANRERLADFVGPWCARPARRKRRRIEGEEERNPEGNSHTEQITCCTTLGWRKEPCRGMCQKRIKHNHMGTALSRHQCTRDIPVLTHSTDRLEARRRGGDARARQRLSWHCACAGCRGKRTS